MLEAALLQGLLAGAVAVSLKPLAMVDLRDRDIRVADVVDLSGVALASRKILGPRRIAVLPKRGDTFTLTRTAVASLVRRSVPLLQAAPGEGDMIFRTRATAQAPEQRCFALVRPIAANEVLSRGDLTIAPCAQAPHGSLSFDGENGVLRARQPLPTGFRIGHVAPPDPPAVETGDGLTLISRAGPVQVARRVVALQPGRDGRPIFVRDGDGHVEAVTLDTRSDGDVR